MKNYFIFTIALISLSFTSCQKDDFYKGDHFFVENDGGTMAVYLEGSIELNTIILSVLGGLRFTDKEMATLENSAHEGYIEEQKLFTQTFHDLVQRV